MILVNRARWGQRSWTKPVTSVLFMHSSHLDLQEYHETAQSRGSTTNHIQHNHLASLNLTNAVSLSGHMKAEQLLLYYTHVQRTGWFIFSFFLPSRVRRFECIDCMCVWIEGSQCVHLCARATEKREEMTAVNEDKHCTAPALFLCFSQFISPPLPNMY